MKELIPKNLWGRNTVTDQEAGEFNPDFGPCCDNAHFRLYLEGTPRDNWNKSATSVFVQDFLRVHPDYPSHEPAVVRMIELKTSANIESMIRNYRESKEERNQAVKDEARARKNRQERQRKVILLSPTVHSLYRE